MVCASIFGFEKEELNSRNWVENILYLRYSIGSNENVMTEVLDSTIRREALPRDGDTVVDLYLQAHPRFLYRDNFITLWREANHSYLAGCYRASMIVAGTALMRTTLDFNVQRARNKNEFRNPTAQPRQLDNQLKLANGTIISARRPSQCL